MKTLHTIAAAAALACALGAHAADAVTDAINAAYPAYRAVLFRTNSKEQAQSQQTMAQARDAWKALSAQYGAKPPAPYDRDAQFGETLAKVAAVYDKADAEIRTGKLTEAHETLEEARDLMADLRRRNGVIVYSDHMNAYHAEMEHMLGEGPKLAAAAGGALPLMGRVGALEFLAKRLRDEAPKALLADADFMRGLQGLEQSVQALKAATLAQDAARIREALGALKKPYSQLFLKFG